MLRTLIMLLSLLQKLKNLLVTAMVPAIDLSLVSVDLLLMDQLLKNVSKMLLTQ